MNLNIIKNTELKGIELYFTSKPQAEILNNLKENGFRWHNFKKCWYAKENEKTLQVVEDLQGSKIIENVNNKEENQSYNKAKRTREEILSYYQYKASNDGYMGGYLLEGANHNTQMTTREINNKIKKDFRELYPEFGISISSKSYSMGSSRTAWIEAEAKDLYVDINNFDIELLSYDFTLNGIRYCNHRNYDEFEKISNIKDENLKQALKEIVYNNFILDERQGARSESKYYLENVKKAIDDLNTMLKSFASVESNSMVDYFHGYDVPEVRVWSKAAKQKHKDLHTMTKEKNGWEKYYNKYPYVHDLVAKLENKQ